jgi:hypothetical protein
VGVVEIFFFFGGHEHSWMANGSFKCGDIPLPSTSRFVYLRVLPGPAEILEFLHQTGLTSWNICKNKKLVLVW